MGQLGRGGPLITNARGAQEWAWVVSQVGELEALAAIERLGNRRPYPLNIARVLGLVIPTDLPLASNASVQEGPNFEYLRAVLRGRAPSSGE